ncbi:MAG: translation initiation factor IF-2 [Bauldia sp.]|nr:translation initiation factor IF-2 [Bauldia sp.]
MTDTRNTGEKTIGAPPKKPLGLKSRTERDTVRQSFSHGRTNTVEVVKVKRKFSVPGDTAKAPDAPAAAPQRPASARPAEGKKAAGNAPQARQPEPQRPAPSSKSGLILTTLSPGEMAARKAALANATVREAEERKRAEEEASRRAIEEARLARERAEADRRQAEEEARRVAEAEAKARAERTAKSRLGEETPGAVPPARARVLENDEEERPRVISRPGSPLKVVRPPDPKPVKRGEDTRRRGKLTLENALDENERVRSLAAADRARQKAKRHLQQQGPREKISREVILPETITIQELASRMAERGVDIIAMLMKQGQMLKINDVIDADMAQIIAEDLGHTVKRVSASDVELGLFDTADEGGDLLPRPPVVTIMGHVDHGKTSLLDAIRKTHVVSGEAGGITQHIGAYQVDRDGKKITFIDTPGHAAFTAMRARGAKVTDIVILVVAADDGVMPQTIEAIHHAKAAKAPMIVAINKIDKPGADASRVRTELLQHEVFVESMGGEVLDVEVSALKGTNLDKLLDTILLQAEVLELKANPNRSAEGTVVEAKLDRGRGPVATMLVQRGTLHIGDIVVAGAEWGRVRALQNDRGEFIDEAGPSLPVEVLGFQGAPEAGDRIAVVENEARAREIADYRQRQKREKAQARLTTARGSVEQRIGQRTAGGTAKQEFAIIVKGDVQGSVEAISGALEKLGTDEVVARIIHSGVGGVTESDVQLAGTSNAMIIGFNVRANQQARASAEQLGIDIRYYNIIYNLVDDVKAAMSGLLTPERRETMLGNAVILEIFNISKVGKIAGCRVTDGTVERGAGVRLIRDNVVIHEGKLSTLKRFKDEVREVPAGQECGMAFEKYEDMRVGDVIECYRVEQIARTL